MVQRYIPDIVKGDKRILVIAGKPVPFTLARIPQNGEVRGNLAAGGVGVAQPLTERDYEIAQHAGADTGRARPVAGRIRRDWRLLTEVNVTSPTCFQEITQQAGFRWQRLSSMRSRRRWPAWRR
jgi:glutathione synthase